MSLSPSQRKNKEASENIYVGTGVSSSDLSVLISMKSFGEDVSTFKLALDVNKADNYAFICKLITLINPSNSEKIISVNVEASNI